MATFGSMPSWRRLKLNDWPTVELNYERNFFPESIIIRKNDSEVCTFKEKNSQHCTYRDPDTVSTNPLLLLFLFACMQYIDPTQIANISQKQNKKKIKEKRKEERNRERERARERERQAKRKGKGDERERERSKEKGR